MPPKAKKATHDSAPTVVGGEVSLSAILSEPLKLEADVGEARIPDSLRTSIIWSSGNDRGEVRLTWLGKELERQAMRWCYLAQSRQQLSAGTSQDPEREAHKTLGKLGVGSEDLGKLAFARWIQVRVPWNGQEEVNWAARIMPWEILVTRAIKEFGSPTGVVPTVFRYLDDMSPQDGSPAPLKPGPPHTFSPGKALAVISLPQTPTLNEMRSSYEREYLLVKEHLGAPVFDRIHSPTRQMLENKLAEFAAPAPAGGPIVHFLGYEESRRSGENETDSRQELWMPGEATGDEWLNCEEAARLLASNIAPELVSFSFCRTAARFAALTVAYGAHASIGFQDIVSDEICESFFSLFYKKWRETHWNLLEAFSSALKGMGGKLDGSGIVLWSRHPLIDTGTHVEKTGGAETAASKQSPRRGPAQIVSERESIVVDAKPTDSLNYSILHNQHLLDRLKVLPKEQIPLGLLKTFKVTSAACPGSEIRVEAEVILYVGDQECRWRSLVVLDQPSKELRHEVCVPLTSSLTRSLRECLRTTMQVSLTHEGVLVHRQTHVVTLLAIDEWRDDGVCHRWLPSFVLPRDPAVGEVMRISRRCLGALSDNFSAGFDGYQSGEGEQVDLQANAIWAVLVQEWQLGYINPPPTFTDQSQRLRNPSSIFRGRAGTCIDLALLMAACLEYAGIHPLIILCPGHAFVGYCREPRGLDEQGDSAALFGEMDSSHYKSVESNDQNPTGPMNLKDLSYSDWVFGKDYHRAIRRYLEKGKMAMLESTGICRSMSFMKAGQMGNDHLANPLQFDHLIDILRARIPRNGVTPLPLLFDPERC